MANAFNNAHFRKLLRRKPWNALLTLYNHYLPTIRAVAKRISKDNNVAQDIAQETLIALWDKKEQIANDHEKPVEHYLARIVRNKSIDHLRRKKKFKDIDVIELLKQFATEENTIETIIERELYNEFRKAINELPPRQHQCLTMKIDLGMSLNEIALQLNISPNTVDSNQVMAIRKLRDWAANNKDFG